MVVKVKESFEETRHVKNNDKSKKYKKYILCGQRNTRYHDRILSNNLIRRNLISFLKRTISFSFV